MFYLFKFIDNWQWEANPFTKLKFGKWEIVIPAREDGSCAINHLSEVKIIIRNQSGHLVSRLSPWAKYVWQPPKDSNQGSNFKQLVWNPPPHEVKMQLFFKEFHKIHCCSSFPFLEIPFQKS